MIVTRYAIGQWLIAVREDRFTGERLCVLRSRAARIVYQPGAVGFQTGRRDTLGAVYRVDGGPPVAWHDRRPVLIAAGIEVEGPGLDNPTGGIVWVPEDEVRGARSIAVRADGRGWGRTFALTGLTQAIGAIRRLQCTVRAGF